MAWTRAEHLEWCKKRAIELVDAGDPGQAVTSMISDLGKDESTADHAGIELGGMLLLSGLLATDQQVRDWINGFGRWR